MGIHQESSLRTIMTERKAVIKNADMSRHADRRCRMRHPGSGEVQHRKRHCCFYQKRVRQEIWPNLALHRRPKLRLLRHPRDEALHLLLSWPGRHLAFQVWISTVAVQTMSSICTTMPPYPASCNAHVSRFRNFSQRTPPWNI